MNLKSLLPLGAAAGLAYVGHKRYGNKYGYLAPAAGGIAGYLVANWLASKLAPAQPQLPPQSQLDPHKTMGEYVPEGVGMGEYVSMPLEEDAYTPPISQQNQPPRRGQSGTAGMDPSSYGETLAEKFSHQQAGSLSNGDGLGSLSPSKGFNESDIDNLLRELGKNSGGNGIN